MNASDFIGTASKETKDEINKNFEWNPEVARLVKIWNQWKLNQPDRAPTEQEKYDSAVQISKNTFWMQDDLSKFTMKWNNWSLTNPGTWEVITKLNIPDRPNAYSVTRISDKWWPSWVAELEIKDMYYKT
jgi:hypothetical protein